MSLMTLFDRLTSDMATSSVCYTHEFETLGAEVPSFLLLSGGFTSSQFRFPTNRGSPLLLCHHHHHHRHSLFRMEHTCCHSSTKILLLSPSSGSKSEREREGVIRVFAVTLA